MACIGAVSCETYADPFQRAPELAGGKRGVGGQDNDYRALFAFLRLELAGQDPFSDFFTVDPDPRALRNLSARGFRP